MEGTITLYRSKQWPMFCVEYIYTLTWNNNDGITERIEPVDEKLKEWTFTSRGDAYHVYRKMIDRFTSTRISELRFALSQNQIGLLLTCADDDALMREFGDVQDYRQYIDLESEVTP